MRKVLYAGISAFALALAFGGSSAWANPFEESVITKSQLDLDASSIKGPAGNANDNSQNSGSAKTNFDNKTNTTSIVTVKTTKIESNQTLNQEVTDNSVYIDANGGRGGRATGGNATANAKARANGGAGGFWTGSANANGDVDVDNDNNKDGSGNTKIRNSGNGGKGGTSNGDGGSANGGVAVAAADAKGGNAVGGGGGGGGTIVAGNVTSIVSQSAGLFNQQFATLSSGAQGGVNFSAFAINSFTNK